MIDNIFLDNQVLRKGWSNRGAHDIPQDDIKTITNDRREQ